ncbi:TPA: tyrosine-type recombinase/integrase [Pseudomonas aeruginosa]
MDKTGKNRSQKESYQPFEKHEVERIYNVCKDKADIQLSNIIKIAAYTGLRIEEICRLKTTSIIDNTLKVDDAKTQAGNRQVPIHSKIKSPVEQLSENSTDGYLIESSGGNKFGNRSDPLSKRFGRLKTQLGFGKSKVFHSIRKTTTTLLQQADVHPLVIMNIVGHKTNIITFDVYSSGSSIDQMRSALEKLNFNFD